MDQEMSCEKCNVHDERLAYFCAKHDEIVCSIGLNLVHSKCKTSKLNRDVAKDLVERRKYRYEQQVQTTVNIANELVDKYREECERVTVEINEAKATWKKFREQINDALDAAEAKHYEILETLENNLFRKASDLKSHLAKLRQMKEQAETLKAREEYLELFICLKRIENLTETLNNSSENIQQWIHKKKTVSFHPNQELVDMLNCRGGFGSFEVGQTKEMIVEAKEDDEFKVKCPDDGKDCCISGSVVMPGNKLLLADHSNSKVKEVDIETKTVKYIRLAFPPWDIAAVSEKRVAVTLPRQKNIQFVTVGTDLKLDTLNSIRVDGTCYGLSIHEDIMAVSFRNPGKVELINMAGIKLRVLSKFNEPYYVTFGLDGETLYVSDIHTVHCVKTNGETVNQFADDNLVNPAKAFVDRSGKVIVCSEGTDTINQIKPGDTKVGVLIPKTDGLQLPHSISYSKFTNQLYVGMEDRNVIKVFKAVLGCDLSTVR